MDQPVHVRTSKDIGQPCSTEHAVARRDHGERARPGEEGQGCHPEHAATGGRRGRDPADLGPVRAPRLGRCQGQDGEPEEEEERMGRTGRSEQEARGHRAARGGHGEGGRCRQEQRREGQVGEIPGGQVHGEGPGEHPGHYPGRPGLALARGTAYRTPARLADERRRAEPNGGSQHALNRRENGGEWEMQGSLEDERDRGNPGPRHR